MTGVVLFAARLVDVIVVIRTRTGPGPVRWNHVPRRVCRYHETSAASVSAVACHSRQFLI